MSEYADRYVKCSGCKVNLFKQDLIEMIESSGKFKCTLCHSPISKDMMYQFVPKEQEVKANKPATAPLKKKWIVLTSKRGREYYHNTETGADQWVKPSDFEAMTPDQAPLAPFKPSDAVKNAVLLQQSKQDALRQGLPKDLVEQMSANMQREQEENDIFNQLKASSTSPKAIKPSSSSFHEAVHGLRATDSTSVATTTATSHCTIPSIPADDVKKSKDTTSEDASTNKSCHIM